MTWMMHSGPNISGIHSDVQFQCKEDDFTHFTANYDTHGTEMTGPRMPYRDSNLTILQSLRGSDFQGFKKFCFACKVIRERQIKKQKHYTQWQIWWTAR